MMEQFAATGTVTVSNPAVAVNIVLGWTPRYVRCWNVNDLASHEYFDGMTAAYSLKSANHADTQHSSVTSNAITQYAGRAPGASITGTVAVTADSAAVTGTSTNFVGELAVGDTIVINGETRDVVTITSSTAMTMSAAYVATASGVAAYDMDGKGAGVTLGTGICDTAADVVRWMAIR